MSTSKPKQRSGRRPRTQFERHFIDGEGKADKKFLGYLKMLYRNQQTTISVTIGRAYVEGNGGSSYDVVLKAARVACKDYDKLYVLLDSDILTNSCDEIIDLVKKSRGAKSLGLHSLKAGTYSCIIAIPCLEGLLLSLLGETPPHDTAQCKRRFQELIGKEAHKLNDRDWEKHFPKDLIEQKREAIPAINQLIIAMTDPKKNIS
ncbi:MAG: hypothetical protein R3Y11_00545 [Pseudomonadota bacterium]